MTPLLPSVLCTTFEWTIPPPFFIKKRVGYPSPQPPSVTPPPNRRRLPPQPPWVTLQPPPVTVQLPFQPPSVAPPAPIPFGGDRWFAWVRVPGASRFRPPRPPLRAAGRRCRSCGTAAFIRAFSRRRPCDPSSRSWGWRRSSPRSRASGALRRTWPGPAGTCPLHRLRLCTPSPSFQTVGLGDALPGTQNAGGKGDRMVHPPLGRGWGAGDRPGRGREGTGGERLMGTAACGGREFKGRAAVDGEGPMGAGSYRQQYIQASCQPPPPPHPPLTPGVSGPRCELTPPPGGGTQPKHVRAHRGSE